MSTENQIAEVKKQPITPSVRFTEKVISLFQNQNGGIEISEFQRSLCQNYFIKLDLSLREAETKRLAKAEKYREPLPLYWENINMDKLANDIMVYSKLGLDPVQKNHLNLIPYKNNKTNKYDVTFIIGYKGLEIKAKKYALEVPKNVVVELVYDTDKFKAIKKDQNNKSESYVFEITDEFNRGKVKGGFYFIEYENPEQNRLKIFSKADIDKRKPEYASAEFWGGEKDVWEKDPQTGRNVKAGKVEVEGWYDEMAYKTIYRAAYDSITIDSFKIDEDYRRLILAESDQKLFQVTTAIEDNANKTEIGIDDADVVEDITHEEGDVHDPENPEPEEMPEPETADSSSKAPF